MEAIKIKNLGGLKCDKPGCGYRNEDIPVKEYPEWINKPCPLCGSNLLTEADYKSFMRVLSVINFINSLFSHLPKPLQKRLEAEGEAEATVNFNGSGQAFIEIADSEQKKKE